MDRNKQYMVFYGVARAFPHRKTKMRKKNDEEKWEKLQENEKGLRECSNLAHLVLINRLTQEPLILLNFNATFDLLGQSTIKRCLMIFR